MPLYYIFHKAQGKTFDNVIFDPSIDKKKLSAGLVYVALSRTRDINSLYLTKPLSLDQIKIDQKVVEFYRGIERRTIVSGIIKL